MSRSRYPRKAQADAQARLHAMAERGELNDSPSPSSSVSSRSTSPRKGRVSGMGGKSKRKVAGPRPSRNDKGPRAKTGCWTCRVRRKKCGGRLAHQDANCVDCVRLGINCLGWGEKRPQWLRKPGAVIAARENIKRELMAKGRVKGQKKEEEDIKPKMSPGSPPSLHTPPTIALNDEELELSDEEDGSDLEFDEEPPSSTPPSSQPSEVESPPVEDDTPEPEMPEPAMPVLVQDDVTPPTLTFRGLDDESIPDDLLFDPDLNPSWSYTGGFGNMYPDLHPPAMSFEQVAQQASQPDQLQSPELLNSAFADLMQFPGNFGLDVRFDQELSSSASSPIDMGELFFNLQTMENTPVSPFSTAPSPYVAPEVMPPSGPPSPQYLDYFTVQPAHSPAPQPAPTTFFRNELYHQYAPRELQLFQDYLNDALPLLHVLKPNQRKRDLMIELAQRSGHTVPPTMLCLALVHKLHRFTQNKNVPTQMADAIYRERNSYWSAAKDELFSSPLLSHERAALAVQMLDCSLLTGCQPNIDYFRYMSILHAYCSQINPSDNMHSLLSMMGNDQIVEYVVKTAFWMDVVGAVSKRSKPRFLGQFRQLTGRTAGEYPPLDMSDFCGCDTDIMLAFAEIAELETYKTKHNASLSLADLCQHAWRIEAQIEHARRPVPVVQSMLFPHPANEQHNPFSAGYLVPPSNVVPTPTQQYFAQPLETEDARLHRRVSDAFRAAARAYLWAAVNGWRPRVPEIYAAVKDTIAAIREIPSTRQNPVDRALVLPLFIAGVLTDEPNNRLFIRGRLNNIADGECGTSSILLQVLEEVWRRRHLSYGQEVCFREVMVDINTTVVLLA
ncbi:hypothetical protein CALVIDRAFT_552695 [Calocera viscosa TUFC12733]|uniref:Zn(2)-C6 fungal-type domain-containing protein n=1 Tax=Calocera viscosa (strain TUFC12733) TaxID=1330018 RepID=A0A167QZ48_CALVF|nr:hypothetical protein CALVIDRAFT_552695 [Calocera viscosa TUFC12733]